VPSRVSTSLKLLPLAISYRVFRNVESTLLLPDRPPAAFELWAPGDFKGHALFLVAFRVILGAA